jgi:hypothetical protein
LEKAQNHFFDVSLKVTFIGRSRNLVGSLICRDEQNESDQSKQNKKEVEDEDKDEEEEAMG